MQTISDIYAAYRIMPALQLHQLRAAAVGATIADALTREIDREAIIAALLLHDMGNIIKSDLSLFPEFSEPDGIAHWELVKRDFIDRYGYNEHDATLRIARDIGAGADVLGCIDSIGFIRLEHVRDESNFEHKVCQYADLRIAPHGVVSMEARINEAHARYANHPSIIPADQAAFEEHVAAARELELQIFTQCGITPPDITEQSVQPLIAELRSFTIAK